MQQGAVEGIPVDIAPVAPAFRLLTTNRHKLSRQYADGVGGNMSKSVAETFSCLP